MAQIKLSSSVPDDLAGARLDQIAAQLFPDYSRARLQTWIKSGELTVDGAQVRPKDKLVGGEQLTIDAVVESQERWLPQSIDLDVYHEDEHLLVVNKPAGLVVHPAAGHHDGTLLNALLHHAPEVGELPRAGIVHRLDKDTTGLMVVAKSLKAHAHLVEQLRVRSMGREYEAIACGVMVSGGRVEEPIGRHPVQRKKMAVNKAGKPAATQYRILAQFDAHTHVRLKLETGRTHQIRVHLAHIGYPIVGDPVYGGRLKLPKSAAPELAKALRDLNRQALHARQLTLTHPDTGEIVSWTSPLPEDMENLLVLLQDDLEHDGEDGL